MAGTRTSDVTRVTRGAVWAARRRIRCALSRRMSAAIWLSVVGQRRAELLGLQERGDEAVHGLRPGALLHVGERRPDARAVGQLVQGQPDLVGERPLEPVDHPGHGRPERDAGVHRDGQDVQEVRQVGVDAAPAAGGLAGDPAERQEDATTTATRTPRPVCRRTRRATTPGSSRMAHHTILRSSPSTVTPTGRPA